MSYIGKTPITGNFVKLDAISVVNGQAGYTMNNGGSAFTDYENVNQFLVSRNGILQAPTTSFTVSGSTLTFASNLATGDVIDFVIVLGNTLDIGTPSDATVTQAKTNFTTTSSVAGLQIKGDGTTAGALQLNCEANSHGIKLQSPPHSANQSYTIKFPSGNITAGKVLKVDSVSGSGTTGVGTLTFGEAGTHTKLITTTVSGSSVSSVDFDSTYITSTYTNYMLIYNLFPVNDGAIPLMRFSASGTFNTGSSAYGHAYYGDGGSDANDNDRGSIEMGGGVGTATGEVASGHALVMGISTATMFTSMVHNTSNITTAAAHGYRVGGGCLNQAEVNDGIRIFFDSGNIEVGSKITLYGINQ